MPSRLQFAAQYVPRFGDIARGPPEEHRARHGGNRVTRRLRLRAARGANRCQHLSDVVRDIIDSRPEYLLRVRQRIEQQIARPVGGGVYPVEARPQHVVE